MTKQSKNYLAHVSNDENGDMSIKRVKTGSRGTMFETLTKCKHGVLRKSRHQFQVILSVMQKEGREYAAKCLEEEMKLIINYLRRKEI